MSRSICLTPFLMYGLQLRPDWREALELCEQDQQQRANFVASVYPLDPRNPLPPPEMDSDSGRP